MSNTDDKNLNIDQRLATLRFICNNRRQLVVNQAKCTICKDKPCLHICPAEVYKYQTEGNFIEAEYENCLECGTCRLICPYDAIEWNYPSDSTGVTFRFG